MKGNELGRELNPDKPVEASFVGKSIRISETADFTDGTDRKRK